MILAWYEKLVDTKGYMLFNKTEYSITRVGDHPPHFHNALEITLCISGEAEVYINGETYPFKEGTVCFLNPWDIHKYRFTQGSARYVVVISPQILNEIGIKVESTFPSITTDTGAYNQLKTLFDLVYRNWDGDDELLRKSFVAMLLSLMKKIMPCGGQTEKVRRNDGLMDILRYVSSNFEKPLNVEAVASRFGYSPNYFSSIFKKLTGVTFKEYLNFCRVVGYQRLRERDAKLSVAEAAEKCGFGSVKSLYRARKRSKEMRTYY